MAKNAYVRSRSGWFSDRSACYLAAGLPVLISNRINIWREIEADRAGCVASDDISGVKSLIERWINTSPEQRDAMRSNARQCFINRFEISRAVDSLLKILVEDIASP